MRERGSFRRICGRNAVREQAKERHLEWTGMARQCTHRDPIDDRLLTERCHLYLVLRAQLEIPRCCIVADSLTFLRLSDPRFLPVYAALLFTAILDAKIHL